MTTNSGLALRLIAYQPNGDRIGLLPMPSSYDVGMILNDVCSLSMVYSDLATRSELLSTPIEVAVEYANVTETGWVEPANGRYVLLESDKDPTDAAKAVTYTLPGYAWILNKAIVNMSAPERVKSGGKRSFKSSSPGLLLATLINEARARGTLPGLASSFTGATDSDGKAWRHTMTGLSFDAGATLLQVLKSLSEGGLVDWCMRGRTLCVYNPNGELAAPRANVRTVKTDSNVTVSAFMDSVSSNLATTVASATRTGTPETARAAANILAIAQHGEAIFDPLGYQLATGRDSTITTVAGGLPVSVWSRGPAADGIERGLGAFVVNLNSPMRYLIAVPRPDATDRPDLLALNTFSRDDNGGILLADTNADTVVDLRADSGYAVAGRQIVTRGITCVELYTYNDSEFPDAKVIVEPGWNFHDNALRDVLHKQLVAQGFDVWSNTGIPVGDNGTILEAKLAAANKVTAAAKAAAAAQKPTSTAAQRNAIVVAEAAANYAWRLRQAYWQRPTSDTSNRIPTASLPPCLRTQSVICKEAYVRQARYIRVAVASSTAQNTTLRAKFGLALFNALNIVTLTQQLPFTTPKGYVSDAEIVDPVVLSAVDLRMGRDLTEAPTHSSLADIVGRVYAYGDGWTQAVVTNPDSPQPWGVFETALASGGTNDSETLVSAANVIIDQGAAERVSMTRGVTIEAARWLPFRHYDAGDIVSAPNPAGVMVPMRIHQLTISRGPDGIAGSLVMADRFLPIELRRSQAIIAAAGAGGSSTLGASVRPTSAVADVRKATTPTPRQ